MRCPSVTALVIAALCLTACAPAFEDGHLSRNINRQREVRDKCLFNEAASLDDRSSTPQSVGLAASMACAQENDKLIQLMATMDRSGEDHITQAVRQDAVVKATSYVLSARSYAPK